MTARESEEARENQRRAGAPPDRVGERRRALAGYIVAAILVAAVIGAILAVVGADDDGASTGESGGAFGRHHDGLEERRLAAGVPTMAEGGGDHIHPLLFVYVNGERITVPANIGIDPARPPGAMAGLHTHDSSGTVHVEAGDRATLDQFFQIWGVELSGDRLGPHAATGSKGVRMWVDGEPAEPSRELVLEDGQRIVLAYGPEDAPPPPEVDE